MGNQIVIDDGRETFDIVNQKGEVLGQFTFIPSDADIVSRYDKTVEMFQEMQSSIEEKELDAESFRRYEEEIGEKIDYLFNAEVSKNFFSITSPFTLLTNGEFFVESVLNAIKTVIESRQDVKLQAARKRLDKYTAKYKAKPGSKSLKA